LDYSSDSRTFGTAGRDNVVRIYDEESKKIKNELRGELRNKTGHNNRIFALKFKP
jgi:WD40 repeat protein